MVRPAFSASVRLLLASLLGFAALVALASPASAIRPDSKAVLSPVDFEVLNRPSPVRGSDNRTHMVYEIQAVNQSQLDVEIRRIAPRAQGNRLGLPFSGTRLAERMRINADAVPTGSTTLGPGGSAMIFIDASYSNARKRPNSVSHAISLAWADPGNPLETVRQTFIGVTTPVSKEKPVVVSSPLRGSKWVAVNGCCTMNAHRGACPSRSPARFRLERPSRWPAATTWWSGLARGSSRSTHIWRPARCGFAKASR